MIGNMQTLLGFHTSNSENYKITDSHSKQVHTLALVNFLCDSVLRWNFQLEPESC